MKRPFLAAFSLLVLAIAPAPAQNAGGATAQGTVKDSSGAVIPGAKIALTHIDTGVRTDTTANHDGFFAFPPVSIGKYRVHCEARGMKACEQDVELRTGQTVDLNPVLAPGQVTETVQVTALVPLVTTTDPTDATTLDAQRIKDLPLNGRDLNTLLSQVTPGVEQISSATTAVRIGGLMQYSTEYQQDGAAANDREVGGSTGLQGLESIGEVRVETSTGNAKSSSPTSVMIFTRSDTNAFHGCLYETIRNNAWGVAKHREDVNPGGVPFQFPKLIRRGLQFQFSYTLTNAYGLAGNSTRDGGTVAANFLPGTVPTDSSAMNRFIIGHISSAPKREGKL